MAGFVFDRQALFDECAAFYGEYPVNVDHLFALLDEKDGKNPGASSYIRKAYIFEVAAASCDVHLFRSCPFYAEVVTGRDRNSVTSGYPPQNGIASWLMRKHRDIQDEYSAWSAPFHAHDVFRCDMISDFAHHYAGAESVLSFGYEGLMGKARAQTARNDNERDFLESVVIACRSAIALGDRFGQKAEKMLKEERDPRARDNLFRIAEAAPRIPRHPAGSFYEALCAIWFTRELCNALEGIGFAVLGHLDRLLFPYYQRDVSEGRMTPAEAGDLIACFLALTDARWDLTDLPGGTNATVIIGGCDRDGSIVFNDVTRMIIDAFEKHGLANPKLQARTSVRHPREYTQALGRLASRGTNVLSVFNDPVIISAHRKRGKALEDCNMYLAGGCQEPTLPNEVNCRAYAYVNLPQLMNVMLFPRRLYFFEKDDAALISMDTARSFEIFYHRFLFNLGVLIQQLVDGFNRFEKLWPLYNPCPLYSASMEGCIENARDVSEGGARYNSNSLGLTGFGTLVDSLFAIRKAVYEEGAVSMQSLLHALETDFQGQEDLRLHLLNKVPKYGEPDGEMRDFTARLLRDIAVRCGGQPNARGGYYEPSLFAFYAYEWLRKNTPATPDGRHAGKGLSRGINPSESTPNIDAATLLHSLSGLDFSDYPGGAVLYMDLPVSTAHLKNGVYADIIRYFLENGGCMLDFNVVDAQQLLDAQRDPEAHRNLVVRVCGYSAPFYSLNREMQDEIIGRTQR